MNIQDCISMSAGILYIIPIIFYYFTNDLYYNLKGLIGLIGTTYISEVLKYYVVGDASPRPKGAKDCNLWCNDGNQEGAPGSPSTHSAEVAFFSGFYYQYTNNIYVKIFLIIYAGAVMLSRYIKKCHTLRQIGVGTILGLSFSRIMRLL